METPISELRALVARLNNLHEIFRVQGEILCYGEAAVEALADLLLSEAPAFPEARVAAAECLGAIGSETAVAALIQVLDYNDIERLGPVQRFAEEMVRNAAARRLGRFPQSYAIEALLSSLRRDHLIGAGEALAQLSEPRAIPHLIECLEDDYKKEKATDALRQFDHAAVPFLCAALGEPRFVLGVEPPISVERRCRAAQLLGELKADDAKSALATALRDESVAIRIASAVALGQFGVSTREVVWQLVAGLDDSDLMIRKSCEEALRNAGAMAITLLADAARGRVIHPSSQHATLQLSLSARLVAIKTLGSIRNTSASHCLINQLKDPDEIIRYRSVAALEEFNESKVRAALEELARRDSSRRIKLRAREALQKLSDNIYLRHNQ